MQKILVASLKGGVGKTTVSIQTALALSRASYKTGILDLDYRTPNVPVAMHDDSPLTQTFESDTLIPPVINGIKVFSMMHIWPEHKCVQVSDDDAMIDVRHMLTPGVIDWGDLDYLVIDTPPTATGVVEVAVTTDNLIGALIVTHASRVSRADMIRTLDLFKEKEVPIIGVICNQVGLHDLTGDSIREIVDENLIPFFKEVPHIVDQVERNLYFDTVVYEGILATTPIILRNVQKGEEKWQKLITLSKSLQKNSS
jgi:Mrp family chromosome partitioning ATPase